MTKDEPGGTREPAAIIDDAVLSRRPKVSDVLVGLAQSGDDPDQALVDVRRRALPIRAPARR